MTSGCNPLLRTLLIVCFLAQASLCLAEKAPVTPATTEGPGATLPPRPNRQLQQLELVTPATTKDPSEAAVNIAQLVKEYLEGNATIEEIRLLPFKEQDVLAALQGAITADRVEISLLVDRAVLLLPWSVKIIVTTAITARPGAVTAIVTAATTAAPNAVADIVTAATTVAPNAVAAIVTAATTAAPNAVADIVSAATTVAPNAVADIVTAATTAAPKATAAIITVAIALAPESRDAILNAVPSPAPGQAQTIATNLEERLTQAAVEGVPTKQSDPSPSSP